MFSLIYTERIETPALCGVALFALLFALAAWHHVGLGKIPNSEIMKSTQRYG
jgi:hypothetical protein